MAIIQRFFQMEDKWSIAGFYALCLTFFLISFPRSWSLYPLGAFLFFGLLEWISKFNLIKELFTRKILLIFPPVVYFVLHGVYFILNPEWYYLEKRLMFFLIPLLGLPIFTSDYLFENIRSIFKAFILGIFLICIFQFSRASWESIEITNGVLKFNPVVNEEVSRFHWDMLSTFEHPTYLTIKVLWVMSLLYSAGQFLNIKVSLRIFFILLLSVFIFFLSSRAGIILTAILFIYFTYDYLKTIRKTLLLLIMIPVAVFVIIQVNSLNKRLNHKLEEIVERSSIEKAGFKGLDPRTKSWFSAINLIKEKPVFGVGLNATNILAEEYSRQGYKTEAELRLNAHNQFLETQLTFGIPGTIILLWMLLTPLIRRKEMWNPELVIPFLIIISVSMIFESILVRQWGIMFFVLFYCLLTIPKGRTEV